MWRLTLLLFCLSPCCGLNILGLFPHPGKSHFDVFEPLLKELSARGHNLTIISHFPQKKALPRFHDISLRGDTDILVNIINLDDLPKSRLVYYFSPVLLTMLAKDSCKGLQTKQMQEFLKDDQKFDVIITEMFNTECFLGFVHKYKAPFIGLSSCTIMPWTNSRFGNPRNPSFVPINFLPFGDKMSFIERLENTFMYLFTEIIYYFFLDPLSNTEAKKYFGQDLPSVQEIANNASLLLVNSHFSLNFPRPLVPNVIEVGGMFLGKPKMLPENLEKFMKESPHGVIYFSMGSMIKAHTFPDEKRTAFLKAFAKLKQRVLWKWENDTIPDKPNNVMIQAWLPQYDILCHPNVKAFISHGGLLGSIEAVQCGVPMIVMPQYGDQYTNARALEGVGAGVHLNFKDVTEESVTEILNQVLKPSFQEQVKKVSERYRDRQNSPMDTAVYWVEYVAKYGGTHMRSAAVDLPFYKEMLLDVIAFFLLVIVVLSGSVYLVCKTACKVICTGTKKQKMH